MKTHSTTIEIENAKLANKESENSYNNELTKGIKRNGIAGISNTKHKRVGAPQEKNTETNATPPPITPPRNQYGQRDQLIRQSYHHYKRTEAGPVENYD
jgi:hypothetical protein